MSGRSSIDCARFRALLEDALRGRPETSTGLTWHEHVLSCAGCRELLEAEEALEALLASLPEPRLPVALARRVLARLERERDRLEALLDLDAGSPGPSAPDDLAQRVLEGLALDRLLDRVPAPEPPPGLAQRVLSGLAVERAPAPRSFVLARPALLAAAAALALVAGLLAWRLRAERTSASPDEVARPHDVPHDVQAGPFGEAGAAPPDELLAALDVLENWDLLTSDDLDLQLASMDPLEHEFVDLVLEAEADESDPREDGEEQG